MRFRLGVILASTLTIFVGVVTLIGLLFGNNLLLPDLFGGASVAALINNFARLFLQIAVTTVALSVVIGVLNLMFVHISRLYRGRGFALNRINSLVLVVTFMLTLAAYILSRDPAQIGARDVSRLLLEDVQIAIESSMAGLLFFVLVYGAFRILHREVSFYRMLFVVTVLVVLIGSLPYPGVNVVTVFYRWLLEVPVSAGARGILLGVALATLLTGVRILIGQDRSYN